VFGGYTINLGQFTIFDDVWVFDPGTDVRILLLVLEPLISCAAQLAWVMPETSGPRPSPRHGHAACFFQNKLIVFGTK
jgi:hypothetical protein